MQLRNRLCHIQLPFLHPLPADEAVQIIHEEHHKADDDGQIADVLFCRHGPHDDQHHIVGGVGQGEVGAAAEGQVHGDEAGGHGQGAGEHIGGAKVVQDEIETPGHPGGQGIHECKLLISQPVYRHLRMVSVIGIAKPGNQGKQRHRPGHAEVGDHLAKVGKGVGDHAVEQAEQDHQCLPDGVALGIEDQRGRADQRGRQRHEIHPVKEEKGYQDQPGRAAPQGQLSFGEVCGQFLHKPSKHKK